MATSPLTNAPLFLGIDGGGSKTTAVLVDAQGVERGRATGGPSNYQSSGLAAAVATVRVVTEMALAQVKASSNGVEAALLGLAGLDRPADRRGWESALGEGQPLARRLELSNDAELILAALPKRQGLGIVAGTGSIALGRDGHDHEVRSGGWGHFMGDEGSGLWLGRQALNAVTRMADGRGPQTALLKLILAEWELKEPTDLIGAVYGGSGSGVDNSRVSRLAGLVFRAAADGDDFAGILIKEAVNELALAIKACDRQLLFDDPPSLAVAGGLLLNYPTLLAALRRRLEAMMTLGPTVEVRDPALVAARAAAGLSGTTNEI